METEKTSCPRNGWHHVRSPTPAPAWPKGVHVYIDGKPAKVKVLHDTLYRPFRNAGKPFKEPLRIGAGAGPSGASTA